MIRTEFGACLMSQLHEDFDVEIEASTARRLTCPVPGPSRYTRICLQLSRLQGLNPKLSRTLNSELCTTWGLSQTKGAPFSGSLSPYNKDYATMAGSIRVP